MIKPANPYQALPPENFWRSGVVDPGPFGLSNLPAPKFPISRDERLFTAGSCFAQRLSRALVAQGYNWIDAEPAPPMLEPAHRQACSYGVFSARTGNIYTTAMLRQWVSWAFDGAPDDPEIWTGEDGRVQDPFRPEIEPGGFADADELIRARTRTLDALRGALGKADVLIFTMGLTEAWINADSGLVYPSCPGTVAGAFDPACHQLVNFGFSEVHRDLSWTLDRLRAVNPGLRVVLTVSPVPLTATAEPGGHALVANTYTKSLLRTVAGELARGLEFVDYFPGYEFVATPPFRAMFYAPNMRTVDPFGVEFVMDHFMRHYGLGGAVQENGVAAGARDDADLVCHDFILDYYRDAG